jgi:hypothetical protein
LGDQKLSYGVPTMRSHAEALYDGLGDRRQAVILQEPEHADIFSGPFTLSLSLCLKAAMKDVETLGQIQISQRQRIIQCTGLSFQKRQVMHTIEKHALFAPGAPVVSHHLLMTVQDHSIDVSLYRDRMVSVSNRYGIVVIVESYQRQRTRYGRLYATCIERCRREGMKSSLIFNQKLRFAPGLAAKTSVQILPAHLGEPFVQFL